MASTNATTCLRYFSDFPGQQHMLTYALLKVLEGLGTDNNESVATDDVLSQLQEVFPTGHLVLEKVSYDLAEVRDKLTKG